MTNLTDKQIEDAFARIRVKFEKRKNETGLEILDGYEGQWEATGSLSTRTTAHGARPTNPATRQTLQHTRSALQGPRSRTAG